MIQLTCARWFASREGKVRPGYSWPTRWEWWRSGRCIYSSSDATDEQWRCTWCIFERRKSNFRVCVNTRTYNSRQRSHSAHQTVMLSSVCILYRRVYNIPTSDLPEIHSFYIYTDTLLHPSLTVDWKTANVNVSYPSVDLALLFAIDRFPCCIFIHIDKNTDLFPPKVKSIIGILYINSVQTPLCNLYKRVIGK